MTLTNDFIKLMRTVSFFSVFSLGCCGSTIGYGADLKSPIGYWSTIDDATGEAKSIVEIKKNSMGELVGSVVKILKTDGDPETKRCEKCKGRRKNQRIKGMTILWGLKPEGDYWAGGEILDPSTGDIYRVQLSLDETDQKLYVRGYLGISLFGRTQTWQRMQDGGASAR